MDAKDKEIYARLDLVVNQGSVETQKSSVEYLLKAGFVLTILVDTDGSKGWIPAYKPDDKVKFSVLLPGATDPEEKTFDMIKILKVGNMYPPVIAQPTTLTAYVNADNATVTIDGGVALIDASRSILINGERYYPYYVTQKSWSTKKNYAITISASLPSGLPATETFSVPVYGINTDTGNKIDRPSKDHKAVAKVGDVYNNWYIFDEQNNWYTSDIKGYLFFNGLNIHTNTTTYDYYSLMGFSSTANKTKILFAAAGPEHPVYGQNTGKLVLANTSSDGTEYLLSEYTVEILWSKTYYNHIKVNSNLYYWAHAYVGNFDEYQIISNKAKTSSTAAGRLWFYPVTFSPPED